MVAPADPEAFGVAEFLPSKPLGIPLIVVASTNDPWMPFDSAVRWSSLWGADLIDLGDAGHINSDAGFGPWPEALALLERLRRAAEFRTAAERLAALSLAHARPAPRHWLARQRLPQQRGGIGIDHRDLKSAAALLQEAGWTVSAPEASARGAR